MGQLGGFAGLGLGLRAFVFNSKESFVLGCLWRNGSSARLLIHHPAPLQGCSLGGKEFQDSKSKAARPLKAQNGNNVVSAKFQPKLVMWLKSKDIDSTS